MKSRVEELLTQRSQVSNSLVLGLYLLVGWHIAGWLLSVFATQTGSMAWGEGKNGRSNDRVC